MLKNFVLKICSHVARIKTASKISSFDPVVENIDSKFVDCVAVRQHLATAAAENTRALPRPSFPEHAAAVFVRPKLSSNFRLNFEEFAEERKFQKIMRKWFSYFCPTSYSAKLFLKFSKTKSKLYTSPLLCKW